MAFKDQYPDLAATVVLCGQATCGRRWLRSANPGLSSPAERRARWEQDQQQAAQLEHMGLQERLVALETACKMWSVAGGCQFRRRID